MKQTITALTGVLLLAFTLTGCQVRSAKSLIRSARQAHGKCEVISKSETDEHTVVVLKDKLQGFTYQVSSGMNSVYIDGSSFGSLESSSDTFGTALSMYVADATASQRRQVCEKYHLDFDETDMLALTIDSESEERNAIAAAEEIAVILNQYNLQNRLDGWEIRLAYSEDWLKAYYQKKLDSGADMDSDYTFSSAGGAEVCHIGSVRLPDPSFRDRTKEHEDYYLEMARLKDTSAVFVRSEQKTFRDTGVGLDRVSYATYRTDPKEMTDPVTFYYFTVKGKEFYICDFIDNQTGEWFSNYDEAVGK